MMQPEPDVPEESLVSTHLVPDEVSRVSTIHANIGILVIVFTVTAIATFVLNGWREWAANAWVVMHWYIVPLPPLLLMVVLLPVELMLEYEEGFDSARTKFLRRHAVLVHFCYYILFVGAIFEVASVAYLVYAHAAGSIVLVQNITFLVLAYAISFINLVLLGAMWYQVHSLEQYIERYVAPANQARKFQVRPHKQPLSP